MTLWCQKKGYMNHKSFNTMTLKKSLEGLSVGDAFGEQFFLKEKVVMQMIAERQLPATEEWHFTDDTVMAIAVVDELLENGEIIQNSLAKRFAQNYVKNPNRGYGGTVRGILQGIYDGKPWKDLSLAVFGGMGSFGNGAAMRVAPLGAHYRNDYRKVKEQAI